MQAQPIRITYVTVSLAVGGAETQLVRLVNGLDRGRFKPSIVCLADGGDLEGSISSDVPVTKPLTSPGGPPGRGRIATGRRALALLTRELRRQRPDVVHAYLPAAYVPASLAAWPLRVPLIVAGRRGFTSGGIYGTAWWRVLASLANRVIDVHICNSKAGRDAALSAERVRSDRTRVVYNGIDLPASSGAALLPELASNNVQAVMIANFIGYKGHAPVLRAAAKVVEGHPHFRLVLIGDGPQRPVLERLCVDLKLGANVVFAGRRQDAAELVKGFEFSILGSSEESLPNALMESMAAGVPVVSTRVGGVPELVDDGEQGLLVPFGDVEAMAKAISWMLDHPDERRRMGDSGRQRITSKFSTERMVAQTEAVYEEFLATRPQRSVG
jgi:glycosyltransferase involved in cell wall biosynthesis